MSATTEIHADDRNVDPVPGRPDPGRDGAIAGAEGLPAVITRVMLTRLPIQRRRERTCVARRIVSSMNRGDRRSRPR